MKRLVPKIIQLTLQMLWLSWKAEALWTDNPAYYVWLERKIPRNAIMGLCKTVTLHHPAFRFTCWQFTHPCRSYMIIYWYYNTYIYICILHGYVVSISWESHSSYSSRGVPWLRWCSLSEWSVLSRLPPFRDFAKWCLGLDEWSPLTYLEGGELWVFLLVCKPHECYSSIYILYYIIL